MVWVRIEFVQSLLNIFCLKLRCSKNLVVVFAPVKKLNLVIFHLEQRPHNLTEMECQRFLFDDHLKSRELPHDWHPMLFSYRIAYHICLCLIDEIEALLERDQESTDNCAWPKLFAVPLNIIELVANIVSARNDEKHFEALI